VIRMLAGAGVALVLGAAGYADRTRHAGLGEVAHCLRASGARLESAPAARWQALSESRVYAVELGRDRGTLLRVGRDVGSTRVQRALDAEGARVAAQSSGRILVLWRGRPAASSAAALNRCLG
jgi:hypothetical protein